LIGRDQTIKAEEFNSLDKLQLTPPYARYLVHLIRPFPDFDVLFIKPVRRKAVHLLQPKPGDRVLDTGCGPGGSFPWLVDAVGPAGEVVGVEISPEIAINAKRRIEKNGWSNVRVIVADAKSVGLEGKFDGLLAFGGRLQTALLRFMCRNIFWVACSFAWGKLDDGGDVQITEG
jgi:SAM-dependent methyltransferase